MSTSTPTAAAPPARKPWYSRLHFPWFREIGDDRREPDEIARLILKKVRSELEKSAPPEEGTREVDDAALEPYKAFVDRRFRRHLKNFSTFAGQYAFAFSTFSVIAIASGVATSSLAAGWNDQDWAKWTMLAFGLAAAISAAINQLWRPAQKAASRSIGARTSCEQGWAYVFGIDPYGKDESAEAEFHRFVRQVSQAITKAESTDEVTAAPTAANGK